jgi:signal transduction histidine kinase
VELLRVLQEALVNARRHSGAGNVEVRLRAGGGTLVAEVTDDGRGFDTASTRAGVGLSAMRERVEGLGGSVRGRESGRRGHESQGHRSFGGRYSSSSTSMTPSLMA